MKNAGGRFINLKRLEKLIAKIILKQAEVFKQWLMKRYKITNEEEYIIRDEIYKEKKIRHTPEVNEQRNRRIWCFSTNAAR